VFGVLAGAKDLPRLRADQDSRTWPLRWQMRQLDEMTVLIVGLGGIGSACARRFAALGATVWGTTRSGESVEGVDRLVPLEELASAISDAVVVTLPGTTQTHHLIDAALLSAARPGLILASVGRGSVIDEAALLQALDDGTVSFAALDVFEAEPLAQDSPLWSHPRVSGEPAHGGPRQRGGAIARRFAADATRLLDGAALHAVVDTVEFY
jgi:phosphoglycerate dehydrogenase-like enzyme